MIRIRSGAYETKNRRHQVIRYKLPKDVAPWKKGTTIWYWTEYNAIASELYRTKKEAMESLDRHTK